MAGPAHTFEVARPDHQSGPLTIRLKSRGRKIETNQKTPVQPVQRAAQDRGAHRNVTSRQKAPERLTKEADEPVEAPERLTKEADEPVETRAQDIFQPPQNIEALTTANIESIKKIQESKAAVEQRRRGFDFVDKQRVIEVMTKLNPGFEGDQELLAETYLRAVNGEVDPGSLVEQLPAVNEQTVEVVSLKVEDPLFKKLAHKHTHNLEIYRPDGTVSVCRCVDVVENPRISVLTDLMIPDECIRLLDLAEYVPSTVQMITMKTPKQNLLEVATPQDNPSKSSPPVVSADRQSLSAILSDSAAEGFVRLLKDRIASVFKLPRDVMERVVIVRYDDQGQYRTHHDGHYRQATVQICLSEPEAGGQVDFPECGFQMNPRRGTAIMYRNVDSSQLPEDALTTPCIPEIRSFNATLPVTGQMYVAYFFFSVVPQPQR
ncbi:MAG: uncharacterized protein KVP18_004157 [Porospora cf. gigantea A]|uniref:uncharacterized protein n=1 Tax=Porospora cf. gigantea A TaxID=2853593 RepID=UPI00355A4887|nr:MAG: hypothetical protein KVP18_004157 [Porospora cf. gigantea A]